MQAANAPKRRQWACARTMPRTNGPPSISTSSSTLPASAHKKRRFLADSAPRSGSSASIGSTATPGNSARLGGRALLELCDQRVERLTQTREAVLTPLPAAAVLGLLRETNQRRQRTRIFDLRQLLDLGALLGASAGQ